MLAGNCSRPKHNKNNSINAHVRSTRLHLRLRVGRLPNGPQIRDKPTSRVRPVDRSLSSLSLSLPLSNLCGLSGPSIKPEAEAVAEPHSKWITVRKRRGRQSVNKCRRDALSRSRYSAHDTTTRAEPSRVRPDKIGASINRERQFVCVRSCCARRGRIETVSTTCYPAGLSPLLPCSAQAEQITWSSSTAWATKTTTTTTTAPAAKQKQSVYTLQQALSMAAETELNTDLEIPSTVLSTGQSKFSIFLFKHFQISKL